MYEHVRVVFGQELRTRFGRQSLCQGAVNHQNQVPFSRGWGSEQSKKDKKQRAKAKAANSRGASDPGHLRWVFGWQLGIFPTPSDAKHAEPQDSHDGKLLHHIPRSSIWSLLRALGISCFHSFPADVAENCGHTPEQLSN